MRDYAKQRPYSIKIRSDSAPSFPDHSNNSLPSELPPSTFPDPQTFLVPTGLRPPFMGEPRTRARGTVPPLLPRFRQIYNRKNRRDVRVPSRIHVELLLLFLPLSPLIIESELKVLLLRARHIIHSSMIDRSMNIHASRPLINSYRLIVTRFPPTPHHNSSATWYFKYHSSDT